KKVGLGRGGGGVHAAGSRRATGGVRRGGEGRREKGGRRGERAGGRNAPCRSRSKTRRLNVNSRFMTSCWCAWPTARARPGGEPSCAFARWCKEWRSSWGTRPGAFSL